jgi:hypothetical protein
MGKAMNPADEVEFLNIELRVLREANVNLTKELMRVRSLYMRATGHPAARRDLLGELREVLDDTDD